MDSPVHELRKWVLSKGTLVKVGGVPFELTEDTEVFGGSSLDPFVTRGNVIEKADSSAEAA